MDAVAKAVPDTQRELVLSFWTGVADGIKGIVLSFWTGVADSIKGNYTTSQ
jgi:hypothetical protein